MSLSGRRRPDFDAGRRNEYPELREFAAAAPQAPGVYTFHGVEAGLPLYIGKSVNLRARLLSHLRNPDEDRMLRQATRISWQRCAGEIGALLLEAQLIKQQQPLYNQKLRRQRQLCALRLDASGRPEVVHSKEVDFAATPELYGLYPGRHAALEGLRAVADGHDLCHALLGLERPVGHRGCFRSMLGQCAGACCGRESAQAHAARLHAALQSLRISCWPYPGAVGLVERWPGDADSEAIEQVHVVRDWCYLGSAGTLQAASGLAKVAAGFDADGYRILCRPLLAGEVEAVELGR